MADRIRVATEQLEQWAHELTVIQSAIAEAEGVLAGFRLSGEAGGELKLDLSQALGNGARIAGSDVLSVVRSMRTAIDRTEEDASRIAKGTAAAARLFQEAEARNLRRVPEADRNKNSKDRPGAVAGPGNSKADLQKKAEEWGRAPGTISDAEYAFLCNATNIASHEKKPSAMRKAFLKELRKLPEGHPLRDLDPSQISAYQVFGVEAIIIRLDKNNAIVAFAGTDDALDLATDVGIAAPTPSVFRLGTEYQKLLADTVIKRLEKDGVKNIQVTGHSLGGYLATDTGMKHESVQECVTFDAPKHTYSEANRHRENTYEQEDKYRNYIPNDSVVNKAGTYQPGTTTEVEVQDNWAGPLPNHQIKRIYEDGMGGMDEINSQWTA